jgi:hypothetical protein
MPCPARVARLAAANSSALANGGATQNAAVQIPRRAPLPFVRAAPLYS